MYVDTLNCVENMHLYGNSVLIECVEFESETYLIVKAIATAIQINYGNIHDFAPIFDHVVSACNFAVGSS